MIKGFLQFLEDVPNSVGAGNIAGMPTKDDSPPVGKRVKTIMARLRRRAPIMEVADAAGHIDEFTSYAAQQLGIENVPDVHVVDDRIEAKNNTSFGSYSPSHKTIKVNVAGRHMADVLRTLAHELVHHKQNEDGRLTHDAGETGSDFENEANSRAGVLMRNYGKMNPRIYEQLIV
jgi:hypothetical protein